MTRKTISRKTKGAVAAVAGGALLVATGGTFAFWTALADLEGGEITTGKLGLIAESGDWEFTHDDPNATPNPNWADLPEGYLMVPGHTVQGTFTVESVIEGTELIASLTIGENGVQGVPQMIPGATVTWEQWDTTSADWVQVDTTSTSTGPYELAADLTGGESFEFRVTIGLPYATADDDSNSYNKDLVQWSLADAKLQLVQQHPSTYTTP